MLQAGTRFNVANRMIGVSLKELHHLVLTAAGTTKAQETTKATEATTKETQGSNKSNRSIFSINKGEKINSNANDVSTGKIKVQL